MSEPERHGRSRQQTGSEAQHRARCRICRHEQRGEIEQAFLDWESPRAIAARWKIASYRAIYRHAHAVGLFERRRERLGFALEQIIEHVSEITPTPAVVLGAIRLAYQMDQKEQGRRAGGTGRGYTPVEISVGDYPYFHDCFEPRSPKTPAQAASPPGHPAASPT